MLPLSMTATSPLTPPHLQTGTRGHPLSTAESYKRHVKEVNKFRKKWMKYVDHDPCYNTNLTLGAENFSIKI